MQIYFIFLFEIAKGKSALFLQLHLHVLFADSVVLGIMVHGLIVDISRCCYTIESPLWCLSFQR